MYLGQSLFLHPCLRISHALGAIVSVHPPSDCLCTGPARGRVYSGSSEVVYSNLPRGGDCVSHFDFGQRTQRKTKQSDPVICAVLWIIVLLYTPKSWGQFQATVENTRTVQCKKITISGPSSGLLNDTVVRSHDRDSTAPLQLEVSSFISVLFDTKTSAQIRKFYFLFISSQGSRLSSSVRFGTVRGKF